MFDAKAVRIIVTEIVGYLESTQHLRIIFMKTIRNCIDTLPEAVSQLETSLYGMITHNILLWIYLQQLVSGTIVSSKLGDDAIGEAVVDPLKIYFQLRSIRQKPQFQALESEFHFSGTLFVLVLTFKK